MTGLGLQPAGTSAASSYDATVAVSVGTSRSLARAIDVSTGDYVQSSDGSLAQMSPTAQRILLLLATRLGTGPDGVGVEMPPTIDDRYRRTFASVVAAALRPVVSDGSARIVEIEPYRGGNPNRVGARVRYVDLVGEPRDGEVVYG